MTVQKKILDLTGSQYLVQKVKSAINDVDSSLSTHIADTDIHVTTADKTKWNNGVTQSYVFRYSSTALTASSTNSNTLLDNTDNLKVGDKVIDSSGVLFSVTAIDTANSTFTIGTALIDLAKDSDVVHTSGNETKSGELTASKFKSNYIQSDTGSIQIQSIGSNRSCSMFNGASPDDGGGFWAYGKDSANGSDCRLQIYNTAKSRYERVDLVNSQFLPTPSGKLDCGRASNKWKSFNGLNPSSLGMPDLSNGIDISSYITNLTGASNINKYTPPVNGWISIGLSGADFIEIYIAVNLMGGTFTKSNIGNNYSQAFMPVIANKEVKIALKGSSIGWAKFYPCQGNV